MGFMDSIREALAGERGDEPEPSAAPGSPPDARHVDREAPEERAEDANSVTGGKHKR
jgi:hypothetical protein